MPDDPKAFITFEPGQLITAESMNAMQEKIRATIKAEVAAAIEALEKVPGADNSQKLGGETAQELLDRFMERAMQEIPTRTGYKKLFKVLNFDEPNPVKHELAACPLVDLYELMPFDVVCAHDDEKVTSRVRFFLYHTSEKKLRSPEGTSITIEDADPPYRIPLAALLDMFDVPHSDASSLGDLETELWKAFFAEPNDAFDADDYCHSPWYERCCREERTVGSLKERGDWDELWLKMKPQQTFNLVIPAGPGQRHLPPNVRVAHHDLDTLSLTYTQQIPADDETGEAALDKLHLMVLLKV